jgi:hypothetical protein
VPTFVVDAAPPLPLTSRRRAWGIPAAPLLIAAGFLALPLVIAVVSLVGYHWHPVSDLALEALRIKDVGGRHTPLVGAQSRFGWDHPGPLMFWLLAPFDRLFGETGLLVGEAVFNAAALVGALVVARRRGGLPLLALVAVMAALLSRAIGPAVLIEPWNPWVPVLPFLLYVLLAWSVAEQDWAMLPWLVGIGSFVVQTHVGFAPPVVGLGGIACALGAFGLLRARGRRSHESHESPESRAVEETTRWPTRRWIIVAAVVGVLAWLAPVVQQFTGSSGNLGNIIESFRHPTEPVAGWEVGFGVMGRELGAVGPWITGDDVGPLGLLETASTIPATLLILATAALGALAWRRGAKDAGRLAALAVAGAALGVVGVSRITGILGPYLARWTWVVAALVWLSLAWSLWSLLSRASMTRALVAAALVAVIGLTASNALAATSVRAPDHQFSDTIARLGPSTAAHLQRDQRYLLAFVDSENVGAMGEGMLLDLAERGRHVRVEPELSRLVGSWRTARRTQVDAVVVVVAGGELERGWSPPPGARRISAYDPLTPRERTRSQRLERQARATLGLNAPSGALPLVTPFGRKQLVDNGVDQHVVDALHQLHERGDAYSVYLAPA